MTKTLAQLITNTQALLLDDGTRFSTATVTAAVRAALKDFNQRAPIYTGEIVDVVSGKKVYPLSASEFASLISVTSVLKQGTDTNLEDSVELPHDAYFENDVPTVRLREAQHEGYLVVRFTAPYTVSGLDSATVSTLPAFYDDVLTDGACYWSCVIRSTGRVETINLNQGVTDSLADVKEFYKQAFYFGLLQAARRKPPVSEPSTAAWNDSWHGWDE